MVELISLINLLSNAASAGADKSLAVAGPLPGKLTKSEAYRCYGRANVDRWLREGLISISEKRVDRLNLGAIAASGNRITYLPVAER